jgi:hypothetical protein
VCARACAAVVLCGVCGWGGGGGREVSARARVAVCVCGGGVCVCVVGGGGVKHLVVVLVGPVEDLHEHVEGVAWPSASMSLSDDFKLNALKDTYDDSCFLARLDEYRMNIT